MNKKTVQIQIIICMSILFKAEYVRAVHPLTRNFSKNEYAAGTQNWSISQDRDNVLYFGNNSGLLSFDGNKWNLTPIINGTSVHSILYSDNNRIYASTFNDFGYFIKQINGELTYHSLVEEYKVQIRSSNELTKIHKSGNLIYFQGDNTIYIYDGKKLKTVKLNHSIQFSTIVNDVLWLSSDQDGLFVLNGSQLFQIPNSELLIGKKIRSILEFGSNQYLIVTSFDGQYVFDGKKTLKYNSEIENFLKTNQVFCAIQNKNHIVYGTVQRGIAIYNLQDRSYSFVNTSTGLQNNTILSMKFDRAENLWLGLDKGIDFVILNTPIQNIIDGNEQYGSGYCSVIDNDRLYLGTNQGVYWINYPLVNSPSSTPVHIVKGMEGQVWSLNLIDGTLFCGDDNGGFIFNGDKIRKIKELPGTWGFKKSRKYGDLIIGSSYKGLFVMKKKGKDWEFSHFIKGNFHESSLMFEEDSLGNIWFSHWLKGIYKLKFNHKFDSIVNISLYNESKGFPSNRYNTVFKIKEDLIFSSEKGIYSYNSKEDKMIVDTKLNKIFTSTPLYMRLHEDNTGNIWSISGKFIGFANKVQDSFSMDSVNFKLLQNKLIPGFEHFNFINDHKLILSTEDGFCLIDTKYKNKTANSFRISFRNVSLINEHKEILPTKFSRNNETLNIEHSSNNIRFEFTAPEYRLSNSILYTYILEGYDKQWSIPTIESMKEYNKLPSGNYIFKVKAKNSLSNETAAIQFEFIILPAWYETNTAISIYILLLIASFIGLMRYINHRSDLGARQMKAIKELELQEKQKIFDEENSAKKKEIKELKNQQLQYELRHKSQELASSTMNLIRKNEILFDVIHTFTRTIEEINNKTEEIQIISRLRKMEKNIRENIKSDNNWKKFEENFDIVYENYLKRLGDVYTDLNVTDKKICAYIKMNLSSKDMSPLLNMSVRSIETNRYRIRKKLGLNREHNLTEFLQKF